MENNKLRDLLTKIEQIEKIEVVEENKDYVSIKLLNYTSETAETYKLLDYDIYMYEALKLNLKNKRKVKTLTGIRGLRDDMREAMNIFIDNVDEYIAKNIKKGLYDKDPYCQNRKTIYHLIYPDMYK